MTTTVLGSPPLLPEDIRTLWRLSLFSLLTFFEGTYLLLQEAFDSIFPFADFVPAGLSATTISGVELVGSVTWVAWFQRLLGALLLVPFSLLIVQRLRLYIGTAVNEEGLGGGLISWLLAK